ncbi:histone deacetylase 6-like [Anser cygnoides]|uniref:histone deacetylase 6-like n=1 Tax=Anser cygnoides TaxID=8845 RepID=UPI0034D24C46
MGLQGVQNALAVVRPPGTTRAPAPPVASASSTTWPWPPGTPSAWPGGPQRAVHLPAPPRRRLLPGGRGGPPWRRGRGRGRGFTLNVGWGGPRAGDPDYVAAATRLVLPVACQFAPQLVLVSAGFDAARGDPLGVRGVAPTFGLLSHLLGGWRGAPGAGAGAPPRGHAPRGRSHAPSDDATPPPDEATPPDDITGGPALAAIMRLGELSLGEPPGGGAGEPQGAGLSAGPAPSAPPCCEEELEEGTLFAVTPLLGCPHLGAVAPCPRGALQEAAPCGVCGSRRENWLCLSCFQVGCGRYAGGTCCSTGGPRGTPWRWGCATFRPGATPAGPTCTTPSCSLPRPSCTASSSGSTPLFLTPPSFSVPPPPKKPHSQRATQVPTPPPTHQHQHRGGTPKDPPELQHPPPQNPRAPVFNPLCNNGEKK